MIAVAMPACGACPAVACARSPPKLQRPSADELGVSLPCSATRRYGFNSGSTQCFYNCMPVAAQVAVNTTLATGALCGG